MLRLNTSIAPIQSSLQNSLGVIGSDAAGYPNGRRPVDDVVDIVLRVAMARLCHPVILGGKQIDLGLFNLSDAPVGLAPLTGSAHPY